MALSNNDIQQLIAILQRGLDNNQDTNEAVETTPSRKRTTKTTKDKKQTSNKNKRTNKFENMPEFNMCKEDLEIDRKIRKPPPSERKAPFQYLKVRCRVCGKEDNVAPDLIESIERYKCNKCATGAG